MPSEAVQDQVRASAGATLCACSRASDGMRSSRHRLISFGGVFLFGQGGEERGSGRARAPAGWMTETLVAAGRGGAEEAARVTGNSLSLD